MGRSGISICFTAEFGRSMMPTFFARSSFQTKRRAGSGSFSSRVRLSAATPLIPPGVTFEMAISRFGRRRSTRTTSVSPWAAPSMKKGPTSPGQGPAIFGS